MRFKDVYNDFQYLLLDFYPIYLNLPILIYNLYDFVFIIDIFQINYQSTDEYQIKVRNLILDFFKS